MLATAPLWASALFFNGFDTDWTGFFLVPVFVVVSLALALRASKGDLVLRWALPLGILLKVVGAAANLYVFTRLYGRTADFVLYYGAGVDLSQQFQATGHLVFYQPVWSSNLLRNLVGCLFILTGPCMSAAMVLFALLGLLGQYFLYRTFCIAFPGGDRRLFAMLLFLVPSLVFWPAAVGKDALILLFLGISVHGFARILQSPAVRPLLVCGIGLLGMLAVRPHIAGMVALAFATCYLLARNPSGLSGTVRKFLVVPLLLATTVFLVDRAKTFVRMEEVSRASEVLERVARNSRMGGSAFTPDSTATSLLNAPFLFFRPFPWEANSVQAGLASLEGLLLLFLLWRRRREFLAALGHFRANPFVFFVLVYTTQFLLVFSVAINNFGLLARQRVMGIPMVAMLMYTGLQRQSRARAPSAARSVPGTTPPGFARRSGSAS
ncbi:MAG: hypothetical protein ACRD3A_02500 [Terriglobales bacterium]